MGLICFFPYQVVFEATEAEVGVVEGLEVDGEEEASEEEEEVEGVDSEVGIFLCT